MDIGMKVCQFKYQESGVRKDELLDQCLLDFETAERRTKPNQTHHFFFTGRPRFQQAKSKMARWDEILSLPVQNPPTLEFSAADLVWLSIKISCRSKETTTSRDDVQAKGIGVPLVLMTAVRVALYDLSRTTYVPKKKNAGRPNTKRGCTCLFIVKRLIAEPSVALIIYTEDKHLDKKGLPCHGPQDTKAARTRVMFAPYISEDLRLQVLSLLHVGVSVETIMQRHSESVVRQGGPSNLDDQLSHWYVRRQERSIQHSTYELDADDAVQNKQIEDKKAIPVAWIIAPRFASSDVHRWMRALYNRVCTKDPTWKLAGFIVDDPLVDVLTIGNNRGFHFLILRLQENCRDVFDCCVLICFWRAVDNICRGQEAWIVALKSLPLASQETCAAVEFYHSQMKLRLLNEKDPGVYQHADWLVDKFTKVHSYFWLNEYSGKDDFARYWKDEWMSGLTSWHKALKIPDSDVVIQGGCAKVADQLVKYKVYVVWNPGSQFGSTMPSISIFQYHEALIDMLHCPTHDSLICDHVISLAVCVQKQLNVLVDLDSSQTALDPIQSQTVDNIEQETVEMVLTNQDTELVNESNCMNEDVSAHDENCGAVNDAPCVISSDVCDELNDLATSGNCISGENVGEEIRCAEMDVEPLSILYPRLD
nr:hypothetical protein CFP56_23736 [Quercus suber]